MSHAVSMSLPDESVPRGVRKSERDSFCGSVGKVFVKNDPQEKPEGCFIFLIDRRSSGVYDSYSPPRDERSISVERTKY